MHYRLKGEITVFLSLTLSSLLMFMIVILSGVKRNLIKSEAEIAMDMALHACFAEYSKNLFEEFHLLYIDPSYRGDCINDDLLLEHFNVYLSENIYNNDNYGLKGSATYDTKITDVYRACDEGNKDIYRQIMNYSRKKYGLASDRELLIMYIEECIGSIGNYHRGYTGRTEYEYLIYGSDDDNYNRQCAVDEYELYKERGDSGVTYFTYSDYELFLKESLHEISSDRLIERLKNIINRRIRVIENSDFDIDRCICFLEIESVIRSDNGYRYVMNKGYGYN